MKELTCITCPIGCTLSVEQKDGVISVSGNKCPRGAAYAEEELRAPKRVVTATCRISNFRPYGAKDGETPRRLPVKSSTGCPKERINALLHDIYALKVKLPVKAGEALIQNWQGSGINVLASRSVA
jgi:CxxC motif-containing protein